jgi:hypothetical protein
VIRNQSQIFQRSPDGQASRRHNAQIVNFEVVSVSDSPTQAEMFYELPGFFPFLSAELFGVPDDV